MNCNSKLIGYGFSSVRGKSHIDSKLPNQDAVMVKQTKSGFVLAVADGVGSQRYSQIGSRSAVAAVRDAFIDFERGVIPVSNITSTIFEKYRDGIPKEAREQASTTCAFAYLLGDSELYLGQVGDGVCYFKINDFFSKLSDKEDDFANLVRPLNASKTDVKWKTRHFNIRAGDAVKLFLATDGVSTDIVPNREEICLDYYCHMLARWPKFLRNTRIKWCLRRWGVPGSNDDKTMIVFWKGSGL